MKTKRLLAKLWRSHKARWAASFLVILALILARPVLADFIARDVQTVATGSIMVGADSADGFTQVYAVNASGYKQYLTTNPLNHATPVVAGDYVAWVVYVNGAGQIQLYQRSTRAVVALSGDSTNLNPAVDSDGQVAWERWVGDRWQIWYYDGSASRQITSGDVAVHPSVLAGKVAFARQSDNKAWRAEEYDTSSNQLISLGATAAATYPRFVGGKVTLEGQDMP